MSMAIFIVGYITRFRFYNKNLHMYNLRVMCWVLNAPSKMYLRYFNTCMAGVRMYSENVEKILLIGILDLSLKWKIFILSFFHLTAHIMCDARVLSVYFHGKLYTIFSYVLCVISPFSIFLNLCNQLPLKFYGFQ